MSMKTKSPRPRAQRRPERRVDRLPGHRVPARKAVRPEDPPRGTLPRSIFSGRSALRHRRQSQRDGLDELQNRMPFADLTEFRKDPRLEKIEDLFTVELIVSYLKPKSAPRSNSVGGPGAQPLGVERTSHAVDVDRPVHRVRVAASRPSPSSTSASPKITSRITSPASR